MAPFRIVDFTVLVEQREGRELLAEATVKVEVAGEVLHTAADGNGPVNALDAALRKALRAFYPQLDAVHLVDYKVRILDGTAATAARTRVVIDSADGERTWSTMGSDTNIIAASAAALADSLEYAIWKSGAELRARRAPLHGAGRGREAVAGREGAWLRRRCGGAAPSPGPMLRRPARGRSAISPGRCSGARSDRGFRDGRAGDPCSGWRSRVSDPAGADDAHTIAGPLFRTRAPQGRYDRPGRYLGRAARPVRWGRPGPPALRPPYPDRMTSPHLRLLRWTMTTGSSGTARAAVVLAAGDHQWEATAESAGAIGALYDAVDGALEPVLGGRVRLVAFDVHAIGETAGADALVELTVTPPACGHRASGPAAATPAAPAT